MQPKILEPECINLYKENGVETSLQDRVYKTDKIATAVTTSFQPSYLVEDALTATVRGRENGQQAELNETGTTNTITTVQKDNLVLVKENTSKGYSECKIDGVCDLSYPDSKTRRGRVQDNGDTCPTITAESNGLCKIEKLGQVSNEGSQSGTVVSENGLMPNLCAGTHGYCNANIATQYRIRKLTPKECWRLMGFTDEDFSKAEKVNSNTQLYKQAGNSIVVNVLEALFAQLF